MMTSFNKAVWGKLFRLECYLVDFSRHHPTREILTFGAWYAIVCAIQPVRALVWAARRWVS